MACPHPGRLPMFLPLGRSYCASRLSTGTGSNTWHPLALCLVDLEKALDTVPHQLLLDMLSNTYRVDACMLETIRWVLVDTWGQVPGRKQPFQTTMGVKQGCPMLPLLFGLYFDHVVEYIKLHITITDIV